MIKLKSYLLLLSQDTVMFDFDTEEICEDDLSDTLPLDLPEEPISRHSYRFGDLTIYFPYPAYESQIQMMDAAIKAVNSSQHALLESPTGTGKTAALLCALLGWVQNEIIKKLKSKPNRRSLRISFDSDSEMESFMATLPVDWDPEKSVTTSEDSTDLSKTDSEMESFMATLPVDWDPEETALHEAQTQRCNENNRTENVRSFYQIRGNTSKKPDSFTKPLEEEEEEEEEPIIIYYATRTHSQIKQVVSQLRKTEYANVVQMSILGSRKQFCINKEALQSGSVDETCEKYIENFEWNQKYPNKPQKTDMCQYYDIKGVFDAEFGDLSGPMDIEDIKKKGSSCQLCPYYGTKVITRSARLIFCTYNHLLHAGIRNASRIKVPGNILVFDEAHNIEDICREIATLDISLERLETVKAYFEHIFGPGGREIPINKRKHLTALHIATVRFTCWLRKQCEPNSPGFETVSRKDGSEVSKKLLEDPLKEFTEIGFGPAEVLHLFIDCFLNIEKRDRDTNEKVFKLNPKIRSAIDSLLYCFVMLYKRDKLSGEYYRLKDYSVFLMRKQPMGSKKNKPTFPDIKLCMLCLNPAVTFQKMREARTVIVASGTLSPIESFASELETEFKYVLKAKHVLGPDRIFAASISSLDGRWDRRLQFTSAEITKNFDKIQEDLGEIILRVCQKIPYGVLLFSPSSDLMAKFKAKWEYTGFIGRLSAVKRVFFEHEVKRPVEFQQMLESYKKCIEEGKGAILFAILRGRVSEGIDFADNLARAVITIGIPYSPLYEEAIIAKRKYNNQKAKESGGKYLNGSAWYDTNAFRALNQALGRSVRHSKDWGAVLVIDSRFIPGGKHRSYLPGWIESSLASWNSRHERSLDSIVPKLQQFLRAVQEES